MDASRTHVPAPVEGQWAYSPLVLRHIPDRVEDLAGPPRAASRTTSVAPLLSCVEVKRLR